MSYKINKTNGELLVDLVDGQIDQTSTDLTLIGRNYKGFGELFNENFIKLLENFARSSAPNSPLVGQLWYDTADERLKIYTGETFKSASGAVIGQTQPNLVAGDLWINSLDNRLYFFDGTDLVLVGPQYSEAQGRTSVEAETIIDSTGQDQTVIFMYIAGLLTGIYSRTQFRPAQNITGFPIDPADTSVPKRQLIRQGFNPVSTDFIWQGSAQSTQSLVSDSGEAFTEANFMKTDRPTGTTSSLFVRGNDGLSIGRDDITYAVLKIRPNKTSAIEMQRGDQDFAIRVTRGNTPEDAFYIDTNLKRVGIYTSTPQEGFDVNADTRINGNATITGNLTVTGDSTFLTSQTLQVEDKNIELSVNADGDAAGDDTVADLGGITLRSTQGNKRIYWSNTTDNWTLDHSIDLTTGNAYKINNVTTLSSNRLHDNILYAEGLISIGRLNDLEVADITIEESTISCANPLTISSVGNITINNVPIEGVDTPVSARLAAQLSVPESDNSSVTTKEYVDREIKAEPVVLTLDTTGLSNPTAVFADNGPYTDVKNILNYLYPSSQKEEFTVARLHCTSYSETSVTGIDVDQLVDDPDNPGGPQISAVRKSYISVDKDGNPSDESVLQDVEFLPVSATAGLVPDRATMEFQVQGGVWVWQRTNVL